MYPNPYFDDATHLRVPGAELVWAIRTWVRGTCHDVPAESPIRDMFARIGAPAAADMLFGLMGVVGRGTVRKLAVACVCHPRLAPDEQLLLDTLALHQHDRHLEAMIGLRSILAPRAALAARDSFGRLAAVLAAAGYWLPEPMVPSVRRTTLAAEPSGRSTPWRDMVH